MCLDDRGVFGLYLAVFGLYRGVFGLYRAVFGLYRAVFGRYRAVGCVWTHTHRDLFGPYGGVFGLSRAVFGPHRANYRGLYLEGKGEYLKSSENNVNSKEPCFSRRTM